MTAKAAGSHELHLARTFEAPASLVFRIWKERDLMIQWWGPKDFTCTHLDHDFRVGGDYRACIYAKKYGDSWMRGRFLEIEEDRRIVFTFMWEEGRDQAGVETTVTVTLTERDGKTEQTFHQTPFLDEETRDSHVGGWSECLDRERAFVEKMAS
jgi:uncharacterized protein YndB with AHSA1/START domain